MLLLLQHCFCGISCFSSYLAVSEENYFTKNWALGVVGEICYTVSIYDKRLVTECQSEVSARVAGLWTDVPVIAL